MSKDLETLEALNNAAIASIDRMESSSGNGMRERRGNVGVGRHPTPLPQQTTTGPSFWDQDPARAFRPSAQPNVSVPLFDPARSYSDPVPRRYHRPALSGYDNSGGYGHNQLSDNFYRRILVSVYKNGAKNKATNSVEGRSEEINRNMEEVITMSIPQEMTLSFSIFGGSPQPSSSTRSTPTMQHEYDNNKNNDTKLINDVDNAIAERNFKLPAVSDHTRNQLSAIVMSGALRILTTMVLNWANDRNVPYELL